MSVRPHRLRRKDPYHGDSGAHGLASKIARQLETWFVQYNPLYFFSVLCVLTGVYFVSRGFEEMGWKLGEFILTDIVQAYEFLVIAGAALLSRVARQKRPAVILGLLEVFLLFDSTLRTEALAAVGWPGIVGSALWWLLVPSKLLVLIWIFQLRFRFSLFLPPLAALWVIAFGPHIFTAVDADPVTIHLLLTWTGVLIAAFVVLLRPKLSSSVPLDAWGRFVLRRCNRAVGWIWGGLFLIHLGAWMVQFNVELTFSHAAPFLLLLPLVLGLEKEVWAWAFGAGAVAVALPLPATVAATALAAGILLALWAIREGTPRLWIGIVLALYLAASSLTWEAWPFPGPFLLPTLAATSVLALMGFFLRMPSAALTCLGLWLPYAKILAPQSRIELGILLLATGFVALVIGVSFSWNRRPKPTGASGTEIPEERFSSERWPVVPS
ncbi:MAG: hypothetical protein ACYTHN_11390 [Planctomycetota bacterium]|jgi:hypothetical protein